MAHEEEPVFTRELDCIRKVVHHPSAKQLLDAYYDPDGPFAATSFLDFGENPPRAISVADILAPSFLGVPIWPQAARRLLSQEPEELLDFLALSEGRELGQSDAFEPGDPVYDAAGSAWWALRGLPDFGGVRAYKLLARKRPALMPVIDRRVEWVLHDPYSSTIWTLFDSAMRDEGIRSALQVLTAPPSTPDLRTLDTLLWMLGSNGRAAQKTRVLAGLTTEAWRPHP